MSHICASTVISLAMGQVDGMDCLAVKQAVKYAKEYALQNGPMVCLHDAQLLREHI